MGNPVIRFRIDFARNSSLGPGKIELLEAIRDSGSLSQGARKLGMSYRRAWLLLQSLNLSFSRRATVAQTGGKGGGGVVLTNFGRDLIGSYRALEREIGAVATRRLRAVAQTAIEQPPSKRTLPSRRLSRGGD